MAILVSFGFCSSRLTPSSSVAEASLLGLKMRSKSEPSRRMYCRPPTVLSLVRSRPSTTWVSVGSTILLSLLSASGCGSLLSGCGAGGSAGGGGVLLSPLPPQATAPSAIMIESERFVIFTVYAPSVEPPAIIARGVDVAVRCFLVNEFPLAASLPHRSWRNGQAIITASSSLPTLSRDGQTPGQTTERG